MNYDTAMKQRFDNYIELLAETVAHADRAEPLRAYASGLALPGEDKSVEPMAAKIEPERVSARHQSMLHFVGQATWSDRDVMAVARDYAVAGLEAHGPMERYLFDDTGIPKRGKASVGVANQYCGILGKNENCQVTVTLSVASEMGSVPVGAQLYLPKKWADDTERRKKVKVPEEMQFATKWAIAVDLIEAHLMDDSHELGHLPVGADAGYGDVHEFRQSLRDMSLKYTVGVKSPTLVEAVEVQSGSQEAADVASLPTGPIRADKLAVALSASAWETVSWGEGTKGTLTSRFAQVLVTIPRGYDEATPDEEQEWLLIEWPESEQAPTRYWLSCERLTLSGRVAAAKARWRIERDYQELKTNFGLDKYQGRGWIGFHHHWTMCIAVYAFAVAERSRLSPPGPTPWIPIEVPGVPRGYQPRGASQQAGTP